MLSAGAPRDCPCHSKLRYQACCRPLHRAEAVAATPEALMRSRYAAFALGLGAYLVNTLSAAHPDRARPRLPLERELSRARVTQRFTNLRILFSATGGPSGEDLDRGQVLFLAGVFVQGRDRSFIELSDFVREGGAWRYAGGVGGAAALFAGELASLTPDAFVARLAAEA